MGELHKKFDGVHIDKAMRMIPQGGGVRDGVDGEWVSEDVVMRWSDELAKAPNELINQLFAGGDWKGQKRVRKRATSEKGKSSAGKRSNLI